MRGRAPPGWTRRPVALLLPAAVAAAMVVGLARSDDAALDGPAADGAVAGAEHGGQDAAGWEGSPPRTGGADGAERADPGPSGADSAAPAEGRIVAPVLLVPGWFDRAAHMEPLRRRFVEAGWPEEWVEAVSFENPVGSNRDHARELARAVADLRRSTGARHVDVLAHSMGGLAVRYHLEHGGARIRRVVFLGTPHHGTVIAHAAWGEGAREMEPGSRLLDEVNDADPVAPGVEALSIRTPVDLRILPRESASLPGARNVEVCCPSHEGLRDHEGTFEIVRDFLLGAEP